MLLVFCVFGSDVTVWGFFVGQGFFLILLVLSSLSFELLISAVSFFVLQSDVIAFGFSVKNEIYFKAHLQGFSTTKQIASY